MSHQKVVMWFGGLIVAAMLFYFFPLFRVTSIDEAGGVPAGKAQNTFSVSDFTNEFWNTQLPNAFGDAVEIGTLLEAVDHDSVAARNQYGRQVGLGGACFFFVHGTGQIEEVTGDHCLLRIDERSHRACIKTDVIIGNAIRDSTGLIDVNQFANSQDFNNLSVELNQKAESEIIAPCRERLRAGVRLKFVGCAQVDDDRDFDPFCMVPVRLEIQARESKP